MRKIFLILLLTLLPGISHAQEYTANYWASTTNVTNGAQTQWIWPFKSRTVTIMNGSTIPVCFTFFGNTTNMNNINQDCTSTISNQQATGNNKVGWIPGSQWITLSNINQQGINLRSSSTAASPVTVIVMY